MPIRLTQRLEQILALTPPCRLAADIGTDHGLLAARLIETGRAERVLCTDLSESSLAKAKETFSRLGILSRARFLPGDGLEALGDLHAEVVIIAGLGGDTLCHVLDQGKNKLAGTVFLLQPMSKHETLRRFLAARGFCVQEEKLVREKTRIYPVLRVLFDGLERRASPIELVCGAHNLLRRDEVTRAYFTRILAHYRRALRRDPDLYLPIVDALARHLRSMENHQ